VVQSSSLPKSVNAIDEFGNNCWLYGSDIPHGDRLYGAVDAFLGRKDITGKQTEAFRR
jgi:hypothetical protein